MTNTSKSIKKQLAVAVTAALLALPLGTTLALADTTAPVETTSTATNTDATSTDTTSSETDTANPDISASDTASTDTTNTDNVAATNEDADNEDEDVVVDADGNEVEHATWLSELIVNIKKALSFDLVRKGELSEKQALAKLAEAQKLMDEGNTEKSQIAFSEYSDKVAEALEYIEKIEDQPEEADKLTLALTKVNHNNIHVLGNLLDKLPEQASQKIAVNIVRSMEKAISKMEKREAKLDKGTVPETTTPATKDVKKSKEDLKVLKKLEQKEKIHPEDDVDQDNQDQDDDKKNDVAAKQNSQPTSVTVAPAKTQAEPKNIQEKGNWNQKNEKNKDRQEDEKQDNQRDDNRRDSDHR